MYIYLFYVIFMKNRCNTYL